MGPTWAVHLGECRMILHFLPFTIRRLYKRFRIALNRVIQAVIFLFFLCGNKKFGKMRDLGGRVSNVERNARGAALTVDRDIVALARRSISRR
jgi:hypothetical protein